FGDGADRIASAGGVDSAYAIDLEVDETGGDQLSLLRHYLRVPSQPFGRRTETADDAGLDQDRGRARAVTVGGPAQEDAHASPSATARSPSPSRRRVEAASGEMPVRSIRSAGLGLPPVCRRGTPTRQHW